MQWKGMERHDRRLLAALDAERGLNGIWRNVWSGRRLMVTSPEERAWESRQIDEVRGRPYLLPNLLVKGLIATGAWLRGGKP